jgi:PPOX class probable F420-dependent enzyme
MASGHFKSLSGSPGWLRALLQGERRAVMTTVDADGAPHSVPVVFALVDDTIVSPIDHKPKKGVTMARVKNLQRDDRVTLLIDHWDEDWPRLGWVMVRGRGVVDPDASKDLMRAINERYPQYAPDEKQRSLD